LHREVNLEVVGCVAGAAEDAEAGHIDGWMHLVQEELIEGCAERGEDLLLLSVGFWADGVDDFLLYGGEGSDFRGEGVAGADGVGEFVVEMEKTI